MFKPPSRVPLAIPNHNLTLAPGSRLRHMGFQPPTFPNLRPHPPKKYGHKLKLPPTNSAGPTSLDAPSTSSTLPYKTANLSPNGPPAPASVSLLVSQLCTLPSCPLSSTPPQARYLRNTTSSSTTHSKQFQPVRQTKPSSITQNGASFSLTQHNHASAS